MRCTHALTMGPCVWLSLQVVLLRIQNQTLASAFASWRASSNKGARVRCVCLRLRAKEEAWPELCVRLYT